MLGVWLRELSEIVLPTVETCQLCGSRRRPGRNPGLCCICEKELDYWEEKYHQCEICSWYIYTSDTCPNCLAEKPPFAKAVAAGGAVGAGLDELVHHGHANSRQVMRAAATLGVLLGGMVTVYEAGKGAIGRAWPQVLCFGLGAGAWELYTQYFR
jgi:hypothetical protein